MAEPSAHGQTRKRKRHNNKPGRRRGCRGGRRRRHMLISQVRPGDPDELIIYSSDSKQVAHYKQQLQQRVAFADMGNFFRARTLQFIEDDVMEDNRLSSDERDTLLQLTTDMHREFYSMYMGY